MLVPLLIAYALFFIFVVAIYNSAFRDGRFTCHRYTLNTYLYILLAFIVLAIETLTLASHKVTLGAYTLPRFFVSFLFTLGFLIATMFTNPQNVLLKHLLWLGFLLGIGFTFYVNYLVMRKNNILVSTLLTVIILVSILSLFAFYRPDLIQLSWGPALLMALTAGIVLQLVMMFTGQIGTVYDKALAYGFIILFSFYVLYDTKRIQVKAKQCVPGKADYVNQSLGIFLDVLNLIADITRVRTR